MQPDFDAEGQSVTSAMLLVVAWGGHTTRARDLARGLGGHSLQPVSAQRGLLASAPARWISDGLETWRTLARTSPDTVVVQNPPIFAPMVCMYWARRNNAIVILDSHPGAFGRRQRIWKWFVPLHRRLVRRALAVMVPSPELAALVEGWGGRAIVVHEAPAEELAADGNGETCATPNTVLVAAAMAPDEPIEAICEAAQLAPQIRWCVTGDPSRLAPAVVKGAPANVEFLGRLPFADFISEMRRSALVMSLTTDSSSVSRAAWEATMVGKALLVSDWPSARDAYAHAAFTSNDPPAIARAASAALDHSEALKAGALDAREATLSVWQVQRDALLAAIARGKARS